MQQRLSIPQTHPPLPPKLTLPTMYDLPSEDPEEPGLPDEFHDLQPQFLSLTLRLTRYPSNQIFTGTDLNLYYDVQHPLWHKRPDWFLVVGVSRLYEGTDLRASYVVWQEGSNPFVVVELLSPGTEKEDLGRYVQQSDAAIAQATENLSVEHPVENQAESVPITEPESRNGKASRETPPSKWEVYERILRIPYYIVFSRHTNQVRFFQLVGGHYQEQHLDPDNPKIWIPELNRGLSLWQGTFQDITRLWLRWYNEQGNWLMTDAEYALDQANQERQRAEQERQRAEQAESQLQQVALNLLQMGMAIAQVTQVTGLSEEQVRQLTDASAP
jgi:Uma2 family endonuclease